MNTKFSVLTKLVMSAQTKNSVKTKGYVTVSQAANLLGVSIDTIRRWEKAGRLPAERLDGKNRYFALADLQNFKATRPLSTNQVARRLSVSASTVRRLEDQGFLYPERNQHGKRLYNEQSVEAYLKDREAIKREQVVTQLPKAQASEIKANSAPEDAVTQAAVETGKAEIEPETQPITEAEPAVAMAEVATEPALSVQPKHHKTNHSKHTDSKWSARKLWHQLWLDKLPDWLSWSLVTAACLVVVMSIMFLLTPRPMARIFGIADSNRNLTEADVSSGNLLTWPLHPFAVAGHTIATMIHPASSFHEVDAAKAFKTNKSGDLVINAALTFPDTSYLKIPDQGLVSNLNAQFVQGHQPGTHTGDLAILPLNGSEIIDHTLTGTKLANGTIQLTNLSSSAIASLRGGGGTGLTGPQGSSGPQGIQGPEGPQGPTGSGGGGTITGVIAGAGLNGGGNSGTVSLSIDTGDSTVTVSNALEVKLASSGTTSTTSSGSGLEITSSGLRMLGGCSSGQILKWNGSGWACAADSGGSGSIDVQNSDGTNLVTNVSDIQFGPTSGSSGQFTVTNLGGGSVRIQLGNNVLQTTSYASTLDPEYVNASEAPASGDISGNFTAGLQVAANAVTLGNDTTGNYLATLSGSTGLTVTGSGSENAAASIALDVTTTAATGTSSGNSGLEVGSDGLRLLGGCSSNQILKWNGSLWACAADATGGGALDVKEGGTVVVSGASALNYAANDFAVVNSSGQADISVDYANSGITRRSGTESITGSWSFNDSSFALQDNGDNTKKVGFELSGITAGTTRTLTVPNVNGTLITDGNLTDITTVGADAVTLGSNTTGAYVANIGTLTGLSATGNSGEGSTPTLSVLYGSAANTAVQGNVTFSCAAGTGNLSGGGTTITVGSGGTCGNIFISNAPSFSTSVTSPLFTNAGQAVLSATGAGNDITLTSADKIILTGFDCSGLSNGGVLTTDSSGVLTCQNDDGGSGGGIGGSGTTNRLSYFSNGTTLGDSWLIQNSSTLELDNTRNLRLIGGNLTLSSGNVDVTGTITASGLITANGNLTLQTGDSFTINGDAFTDLTGTGLAISSGALGVSYGSTANTAAQGNTTFTCAAGTGNLSGGGTTITVGSGGTCGNIFISNAPSFSTSVTSPLFTSSGNLAVTAGGTGTLTLNTSDSTTVNTSGVTIKSGDASTGTNLSAGIVRIDTGTKTGSGTATINIGDVNATALNLGNSNTALALNGSSLSFTPANLTRTSAGNTTLNLNDTADTTLRLQNTDSTAVANLNLLDGNLQVSGTTVITSARVLQNVTADTGLLTSGTLGVARGGTGLSSFTNGDLIYANGATSLTKLGIGSSGQCLQVVSGVPGWSGCASGSLFSVAATSGSSQSVTGGATITFVAGNNISTTAASGPNITIDTVNNPNFTTSVTSPTHTSTGNLSVLAGGTGTLSLNTSDSTTGSTGNITLKSGNASSGSNLSAGTVTIDTGTKTGSGNATLNIADNNATILNIGNANTAINLSGNGTITRAATGNTTLSLNDTSDTAFRLQNTDSTAVANLNLVDGNLQVGGTTVITSARVLQNVTADAGLITSGALSTARGGTGINTSSSTGIATVSVGTWSIVATLSDSQVSDTLTSSIFIGSGSTSNAIDLATAEVAGTLADGNVSDAITISSSGSVDWTALTNYPAACSAGQAVSTLADTPTCTAFNTDTSITLQDAYAAGNTISTSGSDIAFTLNSSQGHTITIAAGATGYTTFSLADGANASPPAQLVLINNADTNQAVAAGLKVTSAAGTITSAFDASGSNITNALSIGGNNILTSGATIAAAELNLLDGHSVALVDTGYTGTLGITGSGALNSGSITSGFGAIDNGADNITTSATIGTASTTTFTGAGGTFGSLLTANGGISANKTLSVNSGGTQNVQLLTYSSPADTSGTNVSQGLNITPTIGNATAGSNTANIFNIDAVTGDAQVTLNAIKIGALTGTTAAETGILIGNGWDAAIDIGTGLIKGGGNNGITIGTACGAAQYIGAARVNGGVTTAGVCTTDATGVSDARLKQNIQTMDGQSALSKLDQLRAVSFNFNDIYRASGLGDANDYGLHYGFIAQELSQVFPELVVHNIYGSQYDGIDYKQFYGLLTSAVQEVNQKLNISLDDLTSLEGSVLTLEDQVGTLDQRVQNLESQQGSGNNGLTDADGNSVDFNNLVVGNLEVNLDLFADGALTVNGTAEFRGTALFDQMVTFGAPVDFNSDVHFNGNANFNSNTGGYAVIAAGQTAVHISFTQPYDQSPIISLTAGDTSGATYHYENVTPFGFDIVLDHIMLQDVHLSWLALSIMGANTYVQQ